MKTNYLESDIEEIVNRLQPLSNLIEGKSFLITGGNGFIGKYLQAVLSKFKNTNIVVIDKDFSMFLDGVKYFKRDVILPESFHTYEKYDYVVAAASIASPRVYKQFPIETMNVGYFGLLNALRVAKENKAKLLFFSSSEVYGTANVIPTPETYVGNIATNNSRSPYDISKLFGECMVYSHVKQEKVNASIALPFNFYGPMANDGRVMPSFMEKLVNNESLEVFDGGSHSRTYCYITDGIVGSLKVLLLGESGQKYNIGNTNQEISVLNLATKIKETLNLPLEIVVKDYPADYAGDGNPTRRVPDISKAKKLLNFEAQVSLEEGISRFYSWAKVNFLRD